VGLAVVMPLVGFRQQSPWRNSNDSTCTQDILSDLVAELSLIACLYEPENAEPLLLESGDSAPG
jgi:hypothetical protein